jgi:hypothetical protein
MNASEQITKHIHGLGDWRGEVLEQLRNLKTGNEKTWFARPSP